MQKCDDKNLCSAFTQYSQQENNGIGMGRLDLMDINKIVGDELAVSCIPMYRYGKKKKDTVAMNYCPFCGGFFNPKSRLRSA
jgi:hypothetical protein